MRLLLLIVLLLPGCKQVPMLPTLTPYKIDIQQGNHVTQDMVAKLKPGMTRAQVRFILGTPLVVDPFRTDRWDYVYIFRKGGEVTEQRRIAVIFEEEKLKRIEGDVVAAESGSVTGAAAPSAAVSGGKPAPAAAAQEKAKASAGSPEKPEVGVLK